MAKFCGKCGARLDEKTGLCPKCNPEEPKKNSKLRKKDNNASKGKRIFLKCILIFVFVCVVIFGAYCLLIYNEFIEMPEFMDDLGFVNKNTDDNIQNIVALEGRFSNQSITDDASAIAAVQSISKELGYENAFNELKPYISTSIGDEYYYRLQQYYKGIPVYGRYVVVVASKSGEALGLTTDVLDIPNDISVSAKLTDLQVESIIKEYAIQNMGMLSDDIEIPELSEDFLVIYNQLDEENACLAYKLNIINGSGYTIIIDAQTGEVLECTSAEHDISETGTNADNTISFPVDYDNGIYTIGDEERGIYVYNLNKVSSKSSKWNEKTQAVTSRGDNIFGNTEDEQKQSPEKAMNLIVNIESIADYFISTFNQGIPFGTLWTFYNDGYNWGKNASGGEIEIDESTTYGFLSVGHRLNCSEADILAHEYTHMVAREIKASIGESKSSGVISEGLADIFACFYTGEWDIDLTVTGGTHRNAENPSQYNYPSSINEKNKSGSDTSHGYATAISHAAYLMYNSGAFSDVELQTLWYKTLLRLPYNCSFYDLRFCMEQAATVSKYSSRQKDAIGDAFEKVGISDSESYKCSNDIGIEVYDKQGNYYDDYTIKIEGTTSGGLFGIGSKNYSVSAEHKTADKHNINLENGSYTITITDNANRKTMKKFSITVKKSYSVENLYAFDFGADYISSPTAELIVYDNSGNKLTDYAATAIFSERKYELQPNSINLDVNNYYDVLLSQRIDSIGVTYYNMFTLRVKDGTTDKLEVHTNFENLNLNVDGTYIPSDAVEFNGHYYYLYTGGIASTYEEALQFCADKGGYLATLTSQEENDFVYSYITQQNCESAYFGFSDSESEGIWKWCTGEPVSYTNWHSGEPNKENPNEDYGMLYYKYSDGSWNDGDFGNNTVNGGTAFICEWGDYQQNTGSQTPGRTTSDERDIVLVLDRSGSMEGTPIQETIKASTDFVDTILEEDASIGVVTYDSIAERNADFSMDKNFLTQTVSGISSGGGTNMESGLQEAQQMLANSNAKKKIIVLMSDGMPNDGKQGEELIAYADEIKDSGTLIYTLGFFENMGSDKSSAQYLMEELASDGCHYEVASADDLVFFFGDIADQINGQKYIYVRIACPVDVSVTYEGETLNSSDEDLNVRTDFGTLTFEESESEQAESEEKDDRIKVLRLKEGADYDLEIVGTGYGTMNYTIGFMDDDGNYDDFRRFENIRITKRTKIDTVAEVSSESILNIDDDGDGKYDTRLRAEENGYGEEVKTPEWVIFALGGAGILIFIDISIFIVLRMRKRAKRGRE